MTEYDCIHCRCWFANFICCKCGDDTDYMKDDYPPEDLKEVIVNNYTEEEEEEEND